MKYVFACLALVAAATMHPASAQTAPASAPVAAVMPDLGHPWQPDEFVAAAAALVAGTEPLPSYATERGKAVLAR